MTSFSNEWVNNEEYFFVHYLEANYVLVFLVEVVNKNFLRKKKIKSITITWFFLREEFESESLFLIFKNKYKNLITPFALNLHTYGGKNYCILPEYHKCVFPSLTWMVGPTNSWWDLPFMWEGGLRWMLENVWKHKSYLNLQIKVMARLILL